MRDMSLGQKLSSWNLINYVKVKTIHVFIEKNKQKVGKGHFE